jgi:hypothetical protein
MRLNLLEQALRKAGAAGQRGAGRMREHGVGTEPGMIRSERLLPGPVERVRAYLTEADKRRQRFAGGAMELREGGQADLLFRTPS